MDLGSERSLTCRYWSDPMNVPDPPAGRRLDAGGPMSRPPTRLRRSRWPWILGLLLIAIVVAIAYRLHQNAGTRAAQGQHPAGPLPVGVATVAKDDIKITINALGTVTPLDTVTVVSQVAGPLIAVNFREGQDVRQGDLLAQIDPRPFQASLDQTQGQLAKDQALLKEAQIDLVRYKTLAAQNSIARQQAEDQEYVVQQDEGQVKVDQALVDNARLNLSYTRIVSPITGRIGLRFVDQGNYVQAGTVQSGTGTGIGVITQMQPITVVFALPEDNLNQVLKRVRQGEQLTVTAFDRGGTTMLATGTLAAIDSQINTSTGTVNLKAQFANGDETLFPNQFVNVVLTVSTVHDATVMPLAAVQRGAPGTFVYLVQPDESVKMQVVKLGPVEGETVAVLSGLSPGDKVVVDGADKLKDGAKIMPRDEVGGGTAGSSTGQAPASAGQTPTPKPGSPPGQHTRQPPESGSGGGQ